jgi:hypothetical protein
VSQPSEPSEQADASDARRLALVAAAQRQWIDGLTDLGGRNTLLYYKDRRAGTLDLGGADPDAVERFEKTGHARLTKLFPGDPDVRADAIRRMQAIYRKARELQEERGIKAGYLATGLARWDELFLEPAAPVLLRPLVIAPTRARYDDFDLTLDDDTEVNPVLLHKLATVFDAGIDRPAPDRIAGQLAKAARDAEIPGFRIDRRKVIGTFTYAKLPMVRDLEAAGDLLADSDLVAAIAGDPQAQQAVAAPDAGPLSAGPLSTGHDVTASGPDEARPSAAVPPLADLTDLADPVADYSVLDADSSQRAAIDAVLAGRSLVIHGPPGTGKSQTIANLIAAMVARGRKVLFVAEKRAAIDAVLSRLSAAGLADLVLDIHEGARDRQRIAADLGATLDQAARAADPDTSALHRRLTDRQRRLARHAAALHRAHEPWGVSAYQVQSALLGVPERARVATRLAAPQLITAELAEELRDELREFTRLEGFEFRPGTTPWFGAPLRTREQARTAVDLAVTLGARTLPEATARLAAACQDVGLSAELLSSHQRRVRLTAIFAQVNELEQGKHSFLERRTRRRQVRTEWQALPGAAPDSEPRLPGDYPALVLAWQECMRRLAELAALAPLAGVDTDPDAAVAALAADQETPWRLPRLYELAGRFARLGLGPLLDEIAPLASDAKATDAARRTDRDLSAPDLVAAAFDWAWYRAILDQIRVRDPDYAAEAGAALDELASDFRRYDAEHLAANRARVRGAWARRLRETVDQHPLQARVIRKQAALRRGHLPLRRLLDQAGDALFALKPCWAMSPLMVSQVLPLARLFDLVIFDEASQVVPADAIGSMIRAHQVVVAGDDRQLPPTSFFHQIDPGDPGDDDEEPYFLSPDPQGVTEAGQEKRIKFSDEGLVSLRAGFESVLDALRPLLPTCPLTWHYRSRDERLVAFSNERIYGGALTTFPGVARDDVLRHVVVGQDGSAAGDGVSAEVTEVVRLILEHARTRPRGGERARLYARRAPRRRAARRAHRGHGGISHPAVPSRVGRIRRGRRGRRRRGGQGRGQGSRGVLRRIGFPGSGARAVLREEPGTGAGRRAGRDHHLRRLRQAPGRPDALPVGPAAAQRRRAQAERRRDPRAPPADRGQFVLEPRRRPVAAHRARRPPARRVPGVRAGRRRPRRRGGLRRRPRPPAGGRRCQIRTRRLWRRQRVPRRRGRESRGARHHGRAAVRCRRLPGRFRGRAPGRPVPDDPRDRGRRRRLPRLGQRARPGPAPQGASGTPRLARAPAVVDRLVHRSGGRTGQAPRRLRLRGQRRPAATAPRRGRDRSPNRERDRCAGPAGGRARTGSRDVASRGNGV